MYRVIARLILVLVLPIESAALDCKSASSIFPARTEMNRWGLDVVDADKSWTFTLAASEVIVAIIDTGLDFSHPDFEGRLWINPGESGLDSKGRDRATNGIDDDRNGYVDDVNGWNFALKNNDIIDRHGHGTHIAGIIAGRKKGISPNARLMILKFYDPAGDPRKTLGYTVEAIEYATKMGAQLINFSAGGLQKSEKEKKAIEKAGRRGIAFVAAAGNEKSNSDLAKYYPADYDLQNVISVGAIGPDLNSLKASNYGVQTVDFSAPGGSICSSSPGGGYEFMSGTSQATAFATGVAALVLGRWKLEPQELLRRLAATGVSNQALSGRNRFGVQLNSFRALAMKDESMSAGGTRAINHDLIGEEEFGTTGASFSPEARDRH